MLKKGLEAKTQSIFDVHAEDEDDTVTMGVLLKRSIIKPVSSGGS